MYIKHLGQEVNTLDVRLVWHNSRVFAKTELESEA